MPKVRVRACIIYDYSYACTSTVQLYACASKCMYVLCTMYIHVYIRTQCMTVPCTCDLRDGVLVRVCIARRMNIYVTYVNSTLYTSPKDFLTLQ